MTNIAIAANGLSKCGKTTFIKMVVNEAEHLRACFDEQFRLAEDLRQTNNLPPDQDFIDFMQRGRFQNITAISAGNAFRAAAHYVIERERHGSLVEHFEPRHAAEIGKLLKQDGIIEYLQNDDAIGRRVSTVAKMAGVQALCEPLFCNLVQQTYNAPTQNGQNLVIMDARDPVAVLRRNNAIGYEENQLLPHTILPVFIDTSAETAAKWSGPDYETELAIILKRRAEDANRPENPVRVPEGNQLTDDLKAWYRQFVDEPPYNENPLQFRIPNDEINLGNLQLLAGFMVTTAQDALLAHHYYDTLGV